ncbi:dual oxidase maturation factor 1-like [Megalops cyprinoides]|uniref:dual oxidase maturation factor 1-like n=1 Tax=Megalops cyprinoides TaxID=118141 RepID=UPI001863EDDD|nr:dual oxidase maturation factor 1-like [Megalops cyprinoides]
MTFVNDIYPFYTRQRTPFIFSLDLLTVILVFLVFALTFLIILPGIRGKLRFFWMFRIILSLFIGAVIVAVNFTSDWAAASVKANTTYKSFSNALVTAEVGLHVGLSGINVTLKGEPVEQLNETINYNEMFRWTNLLDKDYEDALERGLPNPILYIAEKFTLNSPCGLYYQYRYSGRYASGTMWTAFCCWLVANILFSFPVILYAGYMMVATGVFIFFSLASFATIQNVPTCTFTIGTESFEAELSHSFWLALATGLLCCLIGVVVIILDCLVPEKMRDAFSVGADDPDEDSCLGEGYINANFLDEVTTLPLGSVTLMLEI